MYKFSKLEYDNGYFNLGPKFQDQCEYNDCMSLLSIQVFVSLLIKPFPRFLKTIIVS